MRNIKVRRAKDNAASLMGMCRESSIISMLNMAKLKYRVEYEVPENKIDCARLLVSVFDNRNILPR